MCILYRFISLVWKASMKFFITFLFIILSAIDAKTIIEETTNKVITNTNCTVENVYIAYAHDVVAVSWTPVDDSCSSTSIYKVQFKIDDNTTVVRGAVDSDTPISLLLLEKLRCQRVSVKVLVMEDDAIIGESSEKGLGRVLGDITGLSVEETAGGLQVTWKPLNLGEVCKVTYSIRYTVAGSSEELPDLENPRFLIPLEQHVPCTSYDIKVLAASNQLKSEPAQTTYEIGISAVRDVVLKNRDGKVLVDFKPSLNIPEECGAVDYRVIQNDKACFRSDFLIVPVSSTGNQGVATEKSIIRRPGGVQRLEPNPKDDKVYLGWQIPIGATECNMIYLVRFNGRTSMVRNTHYVAALELEACKVDVIQVAPAVVVGQDYVEGQSTDVELFRDIGTVDDLNCSLQLDTVECWWRKPTKSDNCKTIVYEVTYFDGTGKQSHKIEDTTFSFEITNELCTVWFNVLPKGYVGDKVWEGEIFEATIEGCESNFNEKE